MSRSVSTSLFHIVAAMPELALGAHDPEGTARRFARLSGIVYDGRDPERAGFHRFSDGPSARAAEALRNASFRLDMVGWFLVKGSAQALRANTLPADVRPLAEMVTRDGLGPKHRREGGFRLPRPDTARLLAGLARARGNARVEARYDDASYSIVVGGGLADLSRTARLVYGAYHDDRMPKRDGGELANRYFYSGKPGHSEVRMHFADEFGNLMRYAAAGGHELSYPAVVWEEPGNVQFMDLDRSRRHMADLRNYGWKLEVPGSVLAKPPGDLARPGDPVVFGPYRSLKETLKQADRAMSAIRAGQTMEIVPPTSGEIEAARAMQAARTGIGQRDTRPFDRLRLAFFAENGFEERRPLRNERHHAR